MGAIGPVNPDAAGGPPGRQPGGPLATLLAAIARGPFTARARRELLFCLIEAPLGLALLVIPAALSIEGVVLQLLSKGGTSPAAKGWLAIGSLLALLLILGIVMAPGPARGLGTATATWPPGCSASASPDRRRGAGATASPAVRRRCSATGPAGGPRHSLLVKLPGHGGRDLRGRARRPRARRPELPVLVAAVPQSPTRHGAAARFPCYTALGTFDIRAIGGTFAAFAAGAAMLLAAPWVARGAAAADCWLMRGMLGPGPAGAAGRRPGADQGAGGGRLGRAAAPGRTRPARRGADPAGNAGHEPRHGQGEARAPTPIPSVRELVDAAHQGAKDALADLRNLARGIHPPALDNGLPDALATLAATSVIPVELTADITAAARPGDRDDRVLLRRRAAGQRRQAQRREQDHASSSPSTARRSCCG